MFRTWSQSPPAVRAAVKGVLLAAAYFAGAVVGIALSYRESGISPIWPSTGVAALGLHLMGVRYWPGVFVGALLGAIYSHDLGMSALIKAGASTLEALLAVWLLDRLKVSWSFDRVTDVLGLLLATAVAPIISAVVGTSLLAAADQLGGADLPVAMTLWWLGDAMGLLVVAPLMTWLLPRPAGVPRLARWEVLAILAAVVGMALIAFGPISDWFAAGLGRAPLSFMVFPALLWSAMRGGPRGASAALAVTALFAVVRSTTGYGPFGQGNTPEILIMLQLFLVATTVPVLLLAASMCVCHRLLLEMAEAKERAESARFETALLLASVRHDLSHPLQAATLFLATMKLKRLPITARPLLDRTVASLKAMEEMLVNLKEVTTLQAGGDEVQIHPVSLNLILDQLADEARVQAEAKGLRFRYVPSAVVVRTDPVLLSRIVRNLLANAVLYTPSGRVMLGCRRVPNGIRIEVWDTGPGIDSKNREVFFQAFRRGSTVGGGVGLGLSIVRRLADLMAVEIGLRSEVGQGACFWVVVPKE